MRLIVASIVLLALLGCESIYVACSGGCNDVREFDPKSGELIGTFGETGPLQNLKAPSDLLFHPTNKLLVTSKAGGDIRSFDARTGEFLGVFGESAVLNEPNAIVMSSHTKNILVMDLTSGVREFDGDTGRDLGVFGETQRVRLGTSVAIHPRTGNVFVLDHETCCNNGVVLEFDGVSGDFIGEFGETRANLDVPRTMAFHPKTANLFVASGSHNDVREFDGVTGAYLGPFIMPNVVKSLWYIDFSSDGTLYVGSLDTSKRQFHQFDGSTGELIRSFSGAPNAWGFAFQRRSR